MIYRILAPGQSSTTEGDDMPTAVQERVFPTSIDLAQNVREQVIALLNSRLAEAIDLKTQTKYAHWNVKGMQFHQLHELFDLIAEHLEEHSDLLAERVTALGGLANGTARQVARESSIPEYELQAISGEEHVRALVRRLAKFGSAVRSDIDTTARLGDPSTSDLLTEISRAADKDLWLLEAHLQG
jgi:starvation-inducible DNA-binding protein